MNPALMTDFYKITHSEFFPKGTNLVYSNFTPRSSKLANKVKEVFDEKIVFFGLQGVVQELLIDTWNREFFNKPKEEVVGEYTEICTTATGFADTARIAALHDLGYLPIKIKALPEGSLVDIKVPVLTVVNTHPDFYWLTNYLETVLSAELWQMSTSATTAMQYRRLVNVYAEKTCDDLNHVPWALHDFSYRGMASTQAAAKSGAGHLLSSCGTDTIPAIMYLNKYYRGKETFVAGSVPASEHSVTTGTIQALVASSLDQREAEKAFIKDMITRQFPTGIVSLVADSFDYWDVVSNISRDLKEDILNRQPDALGNAKVVFRPDSGDPVQIICGREIQTAKNIDYALDMLRQRVREETPHGVIGESEPNDIFIIDGVPTYVEAYIEWNRYDKQYYYEDGCRLTKSYVVDLTPEDKGSIETLWDIFGGTINSKGYKVLNPRVGLIYGDSITLQRYQEILKRLEAKGFASSNIVVGIGSYTYQCVTRDSYGFAMKATYIEVDGKGVEVFKDPKTDSGTKKSARGLLRVEKKGDNFVLYDKQTKAQEGKGELVTVFENGKLLVNQSLAEIRERLQNSL